MPFYKMLKNYIYVVTGHGIILNSYYVWSSWNTHPITRWGRSDFNQRCTKCWCIAITGFLRPLSNTDQFVHHLKSWEEERGKGGGGTRKRKVIGNG